MRNGYRETRCTDDHVEAARPRPVVQRWEAAVAEGRDADRLMRQPGGGALCIAAALRKLLERHGPKPSYYSDGTRVRGEYVCEACTRLADNTVIWPCTDVEIAYDALKGAA